MSDLSTLIYESDKRQSKPETRVICPINKAHGGLLANKVGVLVCTATGCQHAQAIGSAR